MFLARRAALAALLSLVAVLPAIAADDSLAAVKKRGTLKVGVRADAPSFSSLDLATNQPAGFEVDLARAIAKRVVGSPDKIEFTIVKSDSRIPLVQNGDIDFFISTATITAPRMKQVDFSNVYYRAGQSLLVKRGAPIKGYKDLDGKNVCSVQGTTPEQTIRKLVPKANVVTFETYPECLTGLRSGRVDAVTTDSSILAGYEAQDPAALEMVGGLFSFEPYGIGFKTGSATLEKAVNDALADIDRDGEYARLHQKWLKKPLPSDFASWYGMKPAAAAAKFAAQVRG